MNINRVQATGSSSSLYSAYQEVSNRSSIIDPASCAQDNVINSVIVPTLNDTLPPQESIGGKIINHLTNTYDFVGTLQQELCEDGSFSGQSARELGGVAARTVTSAAIAYGTGLLAAVGAVTGGPIVAAGVIAVGIAGLVVGPPVAERAVNWGFDRINDFLGYTKEWIDRQHPGH